MGWEIQGEVFCTKRFTSMEILMDDSKYYVSVIVGNKFLVWLVRIGALLCYENTNCDSKFDLNSADV